MSPSSSSARRASRISLIPAGQTPADAEAETNVLRLPLRLDFAASRDLHAKFTELRGSALAIDGTAVTFCGALAAQVLLSASRETAATGETFVLKASPALQDDLSRLGVLGEFSNLVEVTEC
jgi:anti-anti-sigma regulatory factor